MAFKRFFPPRDQNQEKESIKYREHVLCFLLSHLNALSVLSYAQAGLLRIVTPCFVSGQPRSESKTKKPLKPKRKASPEIEAALVLLPFLHNVVTMQDDETHSYRDKVKNNKKGRKSFASGADSARLAVKVVFSDPALFDLGDAAFKNPWDVLCALLLKV